MAKRKRIRVKTTDNSLFVQDTWTKKGRDGVTRQVGIKEMDLPWFSDTNFEPDVRILKGRKDLDLEDLKTQYND